MVIVKQLLSAATLAEYRKVLSNVQWQNGKNTAMGMAADVKQNSQADQQAPSVRHLTNDLLKHIGEHPTAVSAALPQKIFPPCFNRYVENETYGFHVDAAVMRMPDSQQVLRSDLSMTLFLSEPEEYQGGELIIATEFGEQNIKLAGGDAVIYPSGSLHKVTPVTKGQRLAAICWIQSLVQDLSLRQTLYELDQSIQRLSSQSQTPRDELDKLHNVYHNLIRQFSQM